MTIRLLECRWLLPDTACTVLFAGAADEVVPAFSVHAASAHGQILDEELAARLTSAQWLSPLGGQTLRAALAALAGPADRTAVQPGQLPSVAKSLRNAAAAAAGPPGGNMVATIVCDILFEGVRRQ